MVRMARSVRRLRSLKNIVFNSDFPFFFNHRQKLRAITGYAHQLVVDRVIGGISLFEKGSDGNTHTQRDQTLTRRNRRLISFRPNMTLSISNSKKYI